MFVLTFTNPKGGSGKTTSCLVSAITLKENNYRVAVIDADKSGNMSRWVSRRKHAGKGLPFEFYRELTPEDVIDRIDKLEESGDYDLCLIDTEGTANLIVGAALSRTDLAIIPMTPSQMDADQASEGASIIRGASKQIRRNIPFLFVFTRASSIMTLEHKGIMKDLKDANLDYSRASLIERAAYRRLFTNGEIMTELDLTPKQQASARTNALAFVNAILLTLQKHAQTAA